MSVIYDARLNRYGKWAEVVKSRVSAPDPCVQFKYNSHRYTKRQDHSLRLPKHRNRLKIKLSPKPRLKSPGCAARQREHRFRPPRIPVHAVGVRIYTRPDDGEAMRGAYAHYGEGERRYTRRVGERIFAVEWPVLERGDLGELARAVIGESSEKRAGTCGRQRSTHCTLQYYHASRCIEAIMYDLNSGQDTVGSRASRRCLQNPARPPTPRYAPEFTEASSWLRPSSTRFEMTLAWEAVGSGSI
ncbi:hypothetical protein DFH09DRAFT_1095016 [Mycena vulgaris]|nr:hypothetical protein DFH09DRAFT_1095016 [Mycena vulgaris]